MLSRFFEVEILRSILNFFNISLKVFNVGLALSIRLVTFVCNVIHLQNLILVCNALSDKKIYEGIQYSRVKVTLI